MRGMSASNAALPRLADLLWCMDTHQELAGVVPKLLEALQERVVGTEILSLERERRWAA